MLVRVDHEVGSVPERELLRIPLCREQNVIGAQHAEGVPIGNVAFLPTNILQDSDSCSSGTATVPFTNRYSNQTAVGPSVASPPSLDGYTSKGLLPAQSLVPHQ